MNSEQWEELYAAARRAARRVVLSWPENVEAEDLANEIMIRLLDSPGSADRTLEEDDRTRQSFLIKMGHQLASIQQQEYDFFSGNYLYDAETVRGYLNSGLLTDDVPHFKAEKSDLLAGLEILKGNQSTYYAEIVNRFVHDITPDWKDSAAHNRITRAVESLTGHMNRIGSEARNAYEGPGNRKVMSNAMAGEESA